MKTRIIKIAGLLFLMSFLGISLISNSQDVKPDRTSRKEARKIEMETNFHVLDSLLQSGQYVLEADFLQGKYGDMVPVTSTLNFIKVDGSKGVLQTGSDTRQGYNNVGGVTAEGNIIGYKVVNDNKRLSSTVTFTILTQIGTYNILMTVSADNNASATISGSTSGRLTWDGHLSTLDNSRIFKGTNTI